MAKKQNGSGRAASAKPKTVNFEASAALQPLLGRQLIPNDGMAIVELVKNAYDSGARRVEITIQPQTAREPGFIRISDDGSGMSLDGIKRLFMTAGYSERTKQVARAERVPTGEKGIGRFAADKLGRTLVVTTATKGAATELQMSIDWKDFENQKKRFSDVTAAYEERPRSGRSAGTTLEMGRLRASWDASRVDEIRDWLRDLFDPFAPPADFEVVLAIGGSRKSPESIATPKIVGDVEIVATVEPSGLNRTIKLPEGAPVAESVALDSETSALIGMSARLVYFNKTPAKKAVHGLAPGVRVYRDGFRIQPFGSATADWLGIAEQRAKRAGHAHVVPSRLFGFVETSRKEQKDLADTTSRQALISNEAAKGLVTVLRRELDGLATVLRVRKEPRWKESRQKQAAELEQARLHTLGILSSGLAHELRQPLQSIRSAAENIQKRLLQLRLQDAVVEQSQGLIDRGVDRIDRNIVFVSQLSRGSVTDRARCDLAEVVKRECAFFESRCSAEGIKLDVRAPANYEADVNQTAITTMLVNLITNSMQAFEASETRGTITVTLERRNGHYIEVRDDGPGIPEDLKSKLFRRFATQKTGGTGVGLYFTRTVVEACGGKMEFESSARGCRFWAQFPDE